MNNSIFCRALVICCHFAVGGFAHADEPDGAWELTSYTLNGEDVQVSGIAVFSDGKFGMIYTMGDSVPSAARAHAGVYETLPNEMKFDVMLWVQHVDGSAEIVPGKQVRADIERRNGLLILNLEGGSRQELRALKAGRSPLPPGGWQLSKVNGQEPGSRLQGFLIASGESFVLIYADDEAGLGRAYGGTGEPRYGSLHAEWIVSVEAGRGKVASGEALETLEVSRQGESLVLSGDSGQSLTFTPW